MVKLFDANLQKEFRAPRLSSSYCFCCFIFLAAAVLPFLLAFSTDGFWRKRAEYEEQPEVTYRKEIIIQAYDSAGQAFTYSSMGDVNDLLFNTQAAMTVQSAARDNNFDGKADLFDFNVTLMTSPSALRNVKAFVFFDYALRERVRSDIFSMAYLDVDTPQGASFIYADGELQLRQKRLMRPTSRVRSSFNTTAFATESAGDLVLPVLLQRYTERNETTEYMYEAPVVMPGGKTASSQLNFKVRVPLAQTVLYRPGFLEIMKFAWIQYLSLLVPISYLLWLLASFIYTNQILESTVCYTESR